MINILGIVKKAIVIKMRGQSNCLASGSLVTSLASYLTGKIKGVFIWNITNSAWEPLEFGVNNLGYSFASTGAGIELMLGYLAHKMFGVNIYIIKTPVSGTALGPELGADQNHGKGDGALYAWSTNIENQAMAAIPELYGEVWLYFNQGERDANQGVNPGGNKTMIAKYYGLNLIRYFKDLGRDVVNSKDQKVVYTILHSPSIYSWFVATLQVWAQPFIKRSAFVPQDDLARNSDLIHLTYPAQEILAKRAFNAFINIK